MLDTSRYLLFSQKGLLVRASVWVWASASAWSGFGFGHLFVHVCFGLGMVIGVGLEPCVRQRTGQTCFQKMFLAG